jgi:hypothetical protein
MIPTRNQAYAGEIIPLQATLPLCAARLHRLQQKRS